MLIKIRTIVIIPVMILLMCVTALMNILFMSRLPPVGYKSSSITLNRPPVSCEDSNISPQHRLVKKTKAKGMACPIFRDEQGFLSEFVAYYQLHGLDHIKLYDDGSTDNSLAEIEPWIRSGFVSVEYNVSGLFQEALALEAEAETWEWYTKVLEHGERIAMQFYCHDHCKEFAIANDFDFMFTLDIDEYMVPHQLGVTVMDAVEELSRNTSALIFPANRVNFASTPHTLEPIDLLTIEAYHYRMSEYGRMNYFRLVQPKLYFHLKKPVDPSFETFIKTCCDIHSCVLNCTEQLPEVQKYVDSVYNGSATTVALFHYARSLEKYDLKRRTWANYNNMAYSLSEYLDRNLGRALDTRASTRYSCQVREVLRNMTEEAVYLRPGDRWYRNVEYNKSLLDEEKVYFFHLKSRTITDFSNFTGLRYRAMVEHKK
jgi:hypothetical protein